MIKKIEDNTQKIERYTVLMGWKNKYCLNDHTTPGNLQIQCNPCQNTMVFSKELEQIILKFVWKNKKTSKGQYNFVKEQSWRDHAP